MTTASSSLPVELVVDILQHVEPHDLVAVARANKALHALSLPYLYNRVQFSTDSTVEQVLQLLSTLQASETVARLVREMALDWHDQDGSQHWDEASKVTRALANVLPATTNLASLSLPRFFHTNTVLKILKAVSCPPVRALHLYPTSLFVAPPFSLLQSLDRLSLWAEDISWRWQPDINSTRSLAGSLSWLSVTSPSTLETLMYIVPMGSLRTLVIDPRPSTINVTSNEHFFVHIRHLPSLRSIYLLKWLSCQMLAEYSSIDPFPDILTVGISLCHLQEPFGYSPDGNVHDTMQVLATIFPHMHTLDVRCEEPYDSEGLPHPHLRPDAALQNFQTLLLPACPRTLRRFAFLTKASFARTAEDAPFVRVPQLAEELQ
ncbi:hypothetical protein EXIGLDRAFT_843937 [Exidia glandulosa HHB12029]|uniref:F-box domain-containing protein n=1 Tax=Exidia glandulosa HHB12029 TaxID=1314781 RepID=A0A165CCM3_EXIGL|nr:hypothetical protein EXIGLDRAFT_843937 [Exidia glandulosa HHB12029]